MSFVNMPDDEIVGVLNEMELDVTLEDIRSPTAERFRAIVQIILEGILDEEFSKILSDPAALQLQRRCFGANNSLSGGGPVGSANSGSAGGGSSEGTPGHQRSIPLITLFAYLRRILNGVDVKDFTLNDLIRPTYQRVVTIISAIFNYVCYSHAHRNKLYKTYSKTTKLLHRHFQLQRDLEELQQVQMQLQETSKNSEICIKETEQQLVDLQKLYDTQNKVLSDNIGILKTILADTQTLRKELSTINEKLQVSRNSVETYKACVVRDGDDRVLEGEIAALQKKQTAQVQDQLAIEQLNTKFTELRESLGICNVELQSVLQQLKSMKEIATNIIQYENEASSIESVKIVLEGDCETTRRRLEGVNVQIAQVSDILEQRKKEKVARQNEVDAMLQSACDEKRQMEMKVAGLSAEQTQLQRQIDSLNEVERSKNKEFNEKCERLVTRVKQLLKRYVEARKGLEVWMGIQSSVRSEESSEFTNDIINDGNNTNENE